MLNQKETEILDQFLDQLTDTMYNNCCNDWDFPENWAPFDRQKFVREYHAWNGNPEEYNPQHLRLMDFQAVSFLRQRMKQRKHDYVIHIKNAKEEWVKNYLDGDEYETFFNAFKNKQGPFTIEFCFTGLGVAKTVYDRDGNLLANITEYDSW